MSSHLAVWTRDAAKRYLNDWPLPPELRWPHADGGERPVQPVHNTIIGYGKWLAETPNFPGLFELIVDVLNEEALAQDPGDGTWLAAKLTALRKKNECSLPQSAAPLAHRLRPLVGALVQPTLPLA